MIRDYGYETLPQTRTFDPYDHVDCFLYSDLHDHLKLLKHGYGKATDHASREIRWGRLTREEGIRRAMEWRGKPLRHVEKFLEWVGMERQALDQALEQWRNPRLWQKNEETGSWELRDSVAAHADDEGVEKVRLQGSGSCDYRENSRVAPQTEERFRLMQKGWAATPAPIPQKG